MNEVRENNIKKEFQGILPEATKEYTNQEIVDLLQNINRTMIAGVYEKTHAEYMRDRDLMIHFKMLAEQYGLEETDTYKRFETNMSDLGYTIASFIKGMKGERIAKKALKLISYDENVKILYNVALEDEDVQAEYDAIVIAPYGIFVVEVKNWGTEMYIDENGILTRLDQNVKYDLPGRMSVKEALLKEYLKELFPERYQGIILFPNENANVVDNYKQMPICYGGGIVYLIRQFNKGRELLTESQINEVVNRILNHHKEQKAPCRVKCDEIVEDFAVLMSAIEESADGSMNAVNELKGNTVYIEEEETKMNYEKIEMPYFLTQECADREKRISKIIQGLTAAVAVVSAGICVTKSINKARK